MPKSKYFPFGFWNSPTAVAPPTPKLSDGSDGDLVILNGQTVQITAGSIKSYNSIDIQAGGTLEIVGAEAWTQIACRNAFNLDGTIRGRTTENAATYTLGADNWGLGGPYSHTVLQAPGGAGGDSASAPGFPGGSQSNGHGGGGNGHSIADQGSGDPACVPYTQGGDGESDGEGHSTIFQIDTFTCPVLTGFAPGGTSGNGGNGSSGNNAIGISSEAAYFSNTFGGNGGGGGGGAGIGNVFKSAYATAESGAGGGARGAHGRHIFILAEEGISGSGTIDMNGDVGFNGGAMSNLNGGKGGGGAGGSAGRVAIRYPSSKSITATVSTSGGSGGLRSTGGYDDTLTPATDGSNGFSTLVNDIGTY